MSAPLMIGGALLGAVGSIGQGNATGDAANFNASIQSGNADQSILQGQENVRRIQRQNSLFQGSQEAAIGASGLQLTGSALNVLSDSAIEGNLMALDAKVAAENRAKGFRAQESLSRRRGKSARRAGVINAGSNLLGTAAVFL